MAHSINPMEKNMKKAIVVLLMLSLVMTLAVGQAKVDEKLKGYSKPWFTSISGKLTSVGSDTLLNLMTYWSEDFAKVYPGVKAEIEGKGSGTAPPALIEGTSMFGPMSRKMKDKEEDAFVENFGYKPTPIIVAIDTIAVYVHKDNPIKGMTLEQLDAVFSKTRNRGGSSDIMTWGQLGLTGEWANKPISIYGRNSASGTYGYFKKVALKKGDYKDTVKEQPGSASVVQGIENDLGGIGYSGIGYLTSGVKAISLGKDESKLIPPSVENGLSGAYALARPLYVYINKDPKTKLDKMVVEFMKFVLSKDGQESVVKDGFIPLPADQAKKQVDKLK
jgi:phosphate transport system substrate-binding protein